MCSIDYCDDRPSVYQEARRVARLQHICGECDRAIIAGETYRFAKMLFDGRWWEYKTCEHCCVGQDWLTQNCGGYMFHGLSEEMEEHMEEYPFLLLSMGRIRLGIRRKWRRFKDGTLMRLPTSPPTIDVRSVGVGS